MQANSNTYAPLNVLKVLYNKIINLNQNVKVLSIATRVDTISDELIAYLTRLNEKMEIWIELGLQTIHNTTHQLLNTCYTKEDFDKIIIKLNKVNIKVVVHIINGLPYEDENMMLDTIKHLNNYKIFGLKIHSLYILKNTKLEQMYNETNFKLLTKDEYIRIVSNQLSILNKDVIIHRISGDAPRNQLVAPLWTLKKFVIMNEIDKYMKTNTLYQGNRDKKRT